MKKRVRIYKAQEGGTPQQPQYSDDQLVSAVMTMLGEQGMSPEEALNQLVSSGVDTGKANQVVSSAVEYINQQKEMNNAQMSGQEYEANKLAEEDAALNQAAQDEQEYAARKARYNQMMADNEDTMDYGDDQEAAFDIIARTGGAMPNKRSFVKNVMSLAKKQMGGDGTSNKADDTDTGERKGGLNAFISGLQNHANEALMKQDAEAMYDMYSQDMDNDQDYGYDIDQDYMQMGGMRPGKARRMQRRMNRAMGQFPAGMFNNRAQMFPSQMNIVGMPQMGLQQFMMPDQGSYLGGPQLANIDVRRTGLFGKPKEYSITFAQQALTNPQLREEVIKQEQNNRSTKAKEIWTEEEVDAKNTSTEKNAEVQAETAKSGDVQTASKAEAQVNSGTRRSTSTAPVEQVEEVEEEVASPTYMGVTPSAKKPVNNSVIGNVLNEYEEAREGAPEEEVDYNYLEGKPYSYHKDSKGKWYFSTPVYDKNGVWQSDGTRFPVTNSETLSRLRQGSMSGKGSKNAELYTLPSKPGYYYRKTNAGDYVKFKGDPTKHNYNSKPITTIKKGDKNFDYLDNHRQYKTDIRGEKMAKLSSTTNKSIKSMQEAVTPKGLPNVSPQLMFRQMGGYIDPMNPDLHKFIYGGGDISVSTPHSVNTADPYFQNGGTRESEYQAWFDRMYGNETTPGYSRQSPVSYDQWMNDYYPDETSADPNKEAYEKAKAAGVNVGDYREGIKYGDLTKFPKMVNSGSSSMNQSVPYNYPYGNIYPPVFGGRQFGPSGRTIQYAGSWAQQQGSAFDPRTGKPVDPRMMGNLPLSKIDVTKTSLFGRRPKEYTMYYGNYGQSPAGAPAVTNTNVPSEGPESRLKGMYRRLTEKGFSTPETSSTGLHDKYDENYREIYGHYPGEAGMAEAQAAGPNEIGKLATKPATPFEFEENNVIRNYADQNPQQYGDLPSMQTRDQGILNLPEIQNERVPQTFRDYNLFPVKDMSDDYLMDEEEDFQNSLPLETFTGTGPVNANQYAAVTGELPYTPATNPSSMFDYADENQMAAQEQALEQMRMQNPEIYNDYPYNKDVFMNQQINDAFAGINQMNKQTTPRVPTRRNATRPVARQNNVQSVNTPNVNSIKKQRQNEFKSGVAYNELLSLKEKAQAGDPKTWRKSLAPIDATGKRMFRKMDNAQKLNYLKQLQKLDKNLYEGYLGLLQEGGMLPQAQTGLFNTNPNGIGNSDVTQFNRFGKTPLTFDNDFKPLSGQYDLGSNELDNPFAMSTDYQNPITGESPAITMGSDGKYINEGLLTDADKANQEGYAAKFKNKNMYTVDFERGVNQFNTGVDWGLQKLGERGQAGRIRQGFNNLTADNLYGSTSLEDRGTYDTNSGLFRPDQMGFKGIVRNGGFLQDGGYNMPEYGEDQETYMTQEEIDDFLANGGELEYL